MARKKDYKVRHIFIGSPGDLSDERKQFKEVLDKVNDIKAKGMGYCLEPIGWEDTLPGKGRPQELINKDLRESDLAVLLLWERWGTPTGEYSSGFEEEYEIALKEGIQSWLFLKLISEKMMADPGPQLSKVIEFREKVEAEREVLYKHFESTEDYVQTEPVLCLMSKCRYGPSPKYV